MTSLTNHLTFVGAKVDKVWGYLSEFHAAEKWLPDTVVKKKKDHKGKKRRQVKYGIVVTQCSAL